jgi:hypothetical protein
MTDNAKDVLRNIHLAQCLLEQAQENYSRARSHTMIESGTCGREIDNLSGTVAVLLMASRNVQEQFRNSPEGHEFVPQYGHGCGICGREKH